MEHSHQPQSLADEYNIDAPSVLIPLPVRSVPKVLQNDSNDPPEWLVNFSDHSSREQLQQLFETNHLAHTKTQLDRMELECYVQPTYEELTVNEPLLKRNQMYNDRKLQTAISSCYKDPLVTSGNQQNDTSSRISISALLSTEKSGSSVTNNNKNVIPIDHAPQASIHSTFDSASFIKRKEISRTQALPLKRVRIDPNDFIYPNRVGAVNSAYLTACNLHIDIFNENGIYNDQHIFLAQDQEFLTRPKKRARCYLVEYGAAPITPDDLSPKATTKWNALAKNDIYKQYRTQLSIRSNLISLAKKIAIACQKEVKKKVLQSVRQGKDAGNRGKKLSREVMMYWRKHDKDKRGAARRAQKAASQLRKRDDEIREAKRQQKKLNFLLTQTELYAHFIGNKTDVEGDVGADGPSVESGQGIDAPEIEDEELAREAAIAAEKAIQATRDRMEAFDEETNERKRKLGIKVKEANSYVPQAPAMPSLEGKSAGINEAIREGEHKFTQPSIFAGKLKNYQIRGLNWLINLYDQGINGILADDMGLGKTIQTIAFLGHLAEEKEIWGPFIVVAPVSTLHNWIQEIARFTPALKALPYWGTAADRKVIRRFWTPKHMYSRNSSMHVVVTSYQLIVQDEKYFRRVKWQYMVLDEAHALKSTASVRWKTLLSFHCRNRLLLTGTPIQNNMAELWALLHFIMPSFFDSHEEFNDWFSKDIENHAEGSGHINEQQLSRLHTILKPFMLRRVKNDIADEMVQKFELEQHCHLTERQKRLYRGIKANISISDLLSQSTKTENSAHLMNLVMQFRKVCNHPELFERRGVTSPFQFIETVEQLNNNPIHYPLPKFLFRESFPSGPRDVAGRLLSPSLLKMFNIYTPNYIEESLEASDNDEMNDNESQNSCFRLDSAFSFARLSGLTSKETSDALQMDLFHQNAQHRARQEILSRKLCFAAFPSHLDDSFLSIHSISLLRRDLDSPLWNQTAFKGEARDFVRKTRAYFPAAVATPVIPYVSDRSYSYKMHDYLYNGRYQQILYGENFKCSVENASDLSSYDQASSLCNSGLVTPIFEAFTATKITVPDFASVINDSGKLKELDRLLFTLKAEGHCVLIYSQMTKMLNLLEEYMNYRKYSYHRLDGASKLSERRDMVSDFQNNGVFAFLLSTRAGGLGINLTAADTVIFYDSDWNPTMDDQAMDRAHRLGQTRPVTVYRLVTVNSIEERILARAKEKHNIQSIVIAGGKFEAAAFNSTEVVSLLLNDNDVEQSIMKTVQENNKSKRKRRK